MAGSRTSSARSGLSGDAWESAARAGYAISGVVHLMLGFFIARVALGGSTASEGETDQGSALSSIGSTAPGSVALWAAVVGWVALAAWQLADALAKGSPGRAKDWKDRAKFGGKAVVYTALAATAASLALGSQQESGDEQAQGFAGSVMAAPAGRLLVACIGVAILAVGAFHVHRGIARTFEDQLTHPPAVVTRLGTIGYPAKGMALAVVGVLFCFAAITSDPDKAEGLDGAIDSVLAAPLGPVAVVLVGLGFMAYGLYLFGRARYARM